MSAAQRKPENEQVVLVDANAGGENLDHKIAELYDRQESLRIYTLNRFEHALAQLRAIRSLADLRKAQTPATIVTQPRRVASKAA